MFGIPEYFTPNIMHFEGPNMGSLFTELWHSTIGCDATDNRDLWNWDMFQDKAVWIDYGTTVAGLGLGLLYGILPNKYWQNFCNGLWNMLLINALKVMISNLEPSNNLLPNHSDDLEGGYVLLRACDRYNYLLNEERLRLETTRNKGETM
ncbi:hypothetical protein BDR03DRAFT_982611 [Suillus americanus]|nr:hypothetical protein BDR03DRAFT_982611 [Suillus americanus]